MWYNPIVKWLLRSPLHGVMSGNTIVLHYHGRKTGREYSLPVNYVRTGQTIYLISSPDRTWWRNLQSGAPVRLELKRRLYRGHAEVLRGEAAVDGLSAMLTAAPGFGRFFNVKIDPGGRPDPADIAAAVHERVILRLMLDPDPDPQPPRKDL